MMRDWGYPAPRIPPKKKSDPLSHPAHSTRGRVAVIDAIMALGLAPAEANVVKYVCRHRHKHADGRECLLKAMEYLRMMIDRYPEWYGD